MHNEIKHYMNDKTIYVVKKSGMSHIFIRHFYSLYKYIIYLYSHKRFVTHGQEIII